MRPNSSMHIGLIAHELLKSSRRHNIVIGVSLFKMADALFSETCDAIDKAYDRRPLERKVH